MSSDPDVEPKDPYQAPPAGCGCLLLIFAVVCSAALAFAAVLPPSLSVGAVPVFVAVLSALLCKVAMDRLRGWAGRPYLPVATAFGAVFFAVAVGVVTWAAETEQIARLHRTPMWSALIAGVPASIGRWAISAPGLFGVVFLGSAFGFAIASLFRKDKLLRDLRAAARGATIACLALAVWGCLRFALYPTLDAETARLRAETGTLEGPGDITDLGTADPPSTKEGRSNDTGPPGAHRTPWGSRTIVQTCSIAGCRVGIEDAAGDGPPPDGAVFQSWGEPILLTRDSARDRIYVRSTDDRLVRSELVHKNGRWVPVAFDPGPIAHRASPAAGLIVLAALLSAIGAASLRRGRALAKEQAALEKAREGTLGEDGWILLSGGETARYDVRVLPPPGPVVVLESGASGSAYRDRPLSAADVLTGTLEEHTSRLQVGRARSYSWALAAAFLGGAPLVAAVFAGLMGPFGGGSPRPLNVGPDVPMAADATEGDWAILPEDVADVNHDGVDDLLARCQLVTFSWGEHIQAHACALDGRTLTPTWRRQVASTVDTVVAAGDHLLVGTAGKDAQSFELSNGSEVARFPDLPKGDVCANDASPRVWIKPVAGPPVRLDLTTGESIRPATDTPKDCRAPRPIPSWVAAPSGAEALSLQRLGVRPHGFIRTERMVLVSAVGKEADKRGQDLPTIVGLDPATAEVKFTVALPGLKKENRMATTPLIVLIRDTLYTAYEKSPTHLAAIDPVTGEVRWDRAVQDTRDLSQRPFFASATRLFVPCRGEIIALDAKTGDVVATAEMSAHAVYLVDGPW